MKPEPVNELGIDSIWVNDYKRFRELRKLPLVYQYGKIVTKKGDILYFVKLFK